MCNINVTFLEEEYALHKQVEHSDESREEVDNSKAGKKIIKEPCMKLSDAFQCLRCSVILRGALLNSGEGFCLTRLQSIDLVLVLNKKILQCLACQQTYPTVY